MKFKQGIASLTLVPAGGGAFEVSVDGKKIYSKLQTGEFPNFDDIVQQVRKFT